MSLSEDVRPLLAARAATDLNAARLLEMFTKAEEILSERSLEQIGDVEMPRLAQVPSGLLSIAKRALRRTVPRFVSKTMSVIGSGR